jgi:hypothetical protein
LRHGLRAGAVEWCPVSVALSGGGDRPFAWALEPLYGLHWVCDAERAKTEGRPIEVVAVASASGRSITNGVTVDRSHLYVLVGA